MNFYLPYLNDFLDEMEEIQKSWEKQIEDVKREYFEVTPKLPRKLKKKRKKELNKEYSFLMSIKDYQENLFKF